MIFDTAIEQVLAAKDEVETAIVKLGKVTSVSGGRAYIQHYGEDTPSGKQYTFIDGYFPEVNDTVAMLPQGNTYIIIGKVLNTAPVEKYATIEYVDDTFLVKAFATKLDDGTNKFELSGTSLIPGTTEVLTLGTSTKRFLDLNSKEINAYEINGTKINGDEFYDNGVRLRTDGIVVKSGVNTYTLLATVSSGTVYLTPSSNNTFALGTKSYSFKEAYLGNFRGSWKSNQTTEREISWNSSNALVPDTNNSIDLGTGSYTFKQLFLNALVGAKWQYQSNSAYNVAWNNGTDILPSSADAVNLGSSTKEFNNVYTKKLYINGTELDISGITLDKLTTKYGTTNYTLTLSVKNPGSSSQIEELAPSVNNKFTMGNSSYKFYNIYSTTFTGDLDGGLKDGTYSLAFDTQHNLNPSTTNVLSLGTSSKQYKNVYGQNLYVNGTAVTSDRRLKKDIEGLSDEYTAFFKALRPVKYKYIDGESGRTHAGFIAQEVEEAVKEAGMTDKDLAVVVKDPEDNYYLRYQEIIAVQTKVIQDLMARVDSLEARVTKLEAERSTKT